MCANISSTLLSILLSKYPERELLDHMVILFLIFSGTTILFPIAAVPFYYIPTNSVKGFQFLHIFANTNFLFFYSRDHNRHEVISHCGLFPPHQMVDLLAVSVNTIRQHHCGFLLNFPSHWWRWASFIYFSAICVFSLEKCLFKSLAQQFSIFFISWHR